MSVQARHNTLIRVTNGKMSLHAFRGKLVILILSTIFCVLTPGVDSALKVCDDCGCGEPNLGNPYSQIVGGRPTDRIKYPWMANMLLRGGLWCGGSLVNHEYVLTAAHCTHGKKTSDLGVLLGSYEPFIGTGEAVVRRVTKVIAHKDYNPKTYDNDIALLKLDKPVKYSKTVRPICIPKAGTSHAGTIGTVIGYGALVEGGSGPDQIHELQVSIHNMDYCKYMTNLHHTQITDNMICAGTGGKDACQGDSGGPLFVSKYNNKYELAGIVSWGIGCARPGFPGLYTKVSNYNNWLGDNLEGCVCSD